MSYTAEILAAADYPAVRALVDPTLTADVVTDALVASDPYLPTAERTVLARWPQALAYRPEGAVSGRPAGDTPDATAWSWVRLAALSLTAARLVDAVAATRVKRESYEGQHSYELAAWDADGLRRRLLADGDDALAAARAEVEGVVVRHNRLTGAFARAAGTRGRP